MMGGGPCLSATALLGPLRAEGVPGGPSRI